MRATQHMNALIWAVQQMTALWHQVSAQVLVISLVISLSIALMMENAGLFTIFTEIN